MNEHDLALPFTPNLLVRASNDTRKRPTLFREVLAGVQAIEHPNGPVVVRVSDIPEPHRTAFKTALRDLGRPAIDSEGELAFFRDWCDWVDGKLQRKTANQTATGSQC
ncbi:hypothetical protein [Caballeronia sp. ATUFL_F2_KS9A]|uniref:hypothetical protein n=1 Tax=Caballeronia sp. ATUFL_F2_KS9A TaxID=2921777 RepID=UPI002028A08B|nr:hypothetical protein [Caballeronia sp. ATUFL_F2_KS9A]